MPQTKDNATEINDPIIQAAMIETPDEDEDTKKLRKDLLEDEDEDSKPTEDEDEEDDSEDAPDEPEDPEESEEDEEKDPEEQSDDKNDPVVPTPKKPVEAEDDESEEDRKTRKERRQERKEEHENYLESIRKDRAKTYKEPEIPEYQPINYEDVDADGNPREFKPEDLAKDRETVQAVGFAKGATEMRRAVEVDNFWRETEYESRILSYDPKLNFLSEENPDGTPNPHFDPDTTELINQRFLNTIGYDAQTGRVQRTDISYEKFARKELQQIEKLAKRFADEREDKTRENVVKQRKSQGIRPGASGNRREINLNDIAGMSAEEFEKNEDAINQKINRELGI